MRFEKELDFARNVAEQAGRLAMENQVRGFVPEIKPDFSPVTSADRANERLMTEMLQEAFPDDGLLGEEGAARESRSGRRWIIDPIDGTRSFMRGIPTWGVLLALEAEGEIVAGVCHMPLLRETYYAAAGSGAYRNGQRIHCSAATKIEDALICFSGFDKVLKRSWSQHLLPWLSGFWSVRSMGGCLDAMGVASGRAEVWVSMEGCAWDFAPFKIVATEAGARFFNFDGKSSIYGGNCVLTVPALEAEVRRFLEL